MKAIGKRIAALEAKQGDAAGNGGGMSEITIAFVRPTPDGQGEVVKTRVVKLGGR
jgi:hypothetical protein